MLKYRYDLLMLPGCKAGRSQALVKAEGEVKHLKVLLFIGENARQCYMLPCA